MPLFCVDDGSRVFASCVPMFSARGSNGRPDASLRPYLPVQRLPRGAFFLLGGVLGGFAKCYELVDKETNLVYASKVVSKQALVRSRQREKLAQEISIHRSLDHKHVVGFHGYFEDDKNVYIVLELCSMRSLMEMHRRRKTLTEVEARYFLHQILLGCRYLGQQRVIHRDLKLGNLLLNERMELKIADFGLSARVNFEGERKKTLCGTPNYIAPEILSKKGHSFEVDIWSIGCILFTLLVGHPPFETSTLKETYTRIKRNEYHVPPGLSSPARSLIRRMLQPEPHLRPSIEALLQDEFLTCGPLPVQLPTSCLTTEPRFDTLNATLSIGGRKPLLELNTGREALEAKVTSIRVNLDKIKPAERLKPYHLGGHATVAVAMNVVGVQGKASQREAHLGELRRLLTRLIDSNPPERHFGAADEAEDPASVPVLWISKWVDYTDRYGLGYQLCDDSIGVMYNDNTRMLLLSNRVSVTYVDVNSLENYYSLEEYPAVLEKKVTLLKYFCSYMKEFLFTTGGDVAPRECDNLVRLPCLSSWFRTRSAISFYLTSGTVQINFFQDHTKLILCPLMAAVSYIDENRTFHTYRFETLRTLGCPEDLFARLKYARTIVERLASFSAP